MCCKNNDKVFSSKCLKAFSIILFFVSIGMFIASFVAFQPVNQSMAQGKITDNFQDEGNEVGKKVCKWGGTFGLVMAIFAYLTATQKMPYFACPFALGSFFMGCVFAAVLVTTISEETAVYYKTQFCQAFANQEHKVGAGHDPLNAEKAAVLMDVNFIDRLMCSDLCPCSINHKSQWEDKFPENELKRRQRTWNTVGLMPITPM